MKRRSGAEHDLRVRLRMTLGAWCTPHDDRIDALMEAIKSQDLLIDDGTIHAVLETDMIDSGDESTAHTVYSVTEDLEEPSND